MHGGGKRGDLAIGMAVVRGRSMEPTLQEGDRLLVAYGTTPRAGRLVVVRLPGVPGLVVKRLAFTTDDGWWVERDNPREGVDSWHVGAVPQEDLLAVVIARIWPHPRILRPCRLARLWHNLVHG